MIKVTVDGEVYEYEQNKLLNTEAIALQKETGMTPPQFGEALEQGDAVAITGLVWLLWRRAGRHIRFADCEFNMVDLRIEGGDDDGDEGDGDGSDDARPTGEVVEARVEATSKPDETATSPHSPSTST